MNAKEDSHAVTERQLREARESKGAQSMTATDWLDPVNDLPDWQDLGRAIEVKCEDGSVESGLLTYEDMTAGPDEMPLFLVEYRVGNAAALF